MTHYPKEKGKRWEIVIVANSDITYDNRVRRLCRALSEEGKTGLLICSQAQEKRLFNFRIINLQLPKEGFKSFFKFFIKSLLVLLTLRFKLVIACDLDASPSARLVSMLKQKFLIYDAHEYITGTASVQRTAWRHMIWHLLEQIFVRISPIGMTVNNSIAEILHKKYGVKYLVIKNVPYLEENSPPSKCLYPPAVIYAGSLSSDRRIKELLQAISQISFPCQVLITGNAEHHEDIKSTIAKLGIEDRVKFLGLLKYDDLKSLIKECWLGVNLLSPQDLNSYYSLANKFFDYIHCGIPQITMDFPEYRKHNKEYKVAILLKKAYPSEISRALRLLHEKPYLYLSMQYNTAFARQKWNFQKEQKRLKMIITSLLEYES